MGIDGDEFMRFLKWLIVCVCIFALVGAAAIGAIVVKFLTH